MSDREHNKLCALSKHKKCICSCGGKLHGKDVKEYKAGPLDKPIGIEDGGEIEIWLKAITGKVIDCFCNEQLVCGGFVGYPHENGLADSQGKRWWVFLHCDNCGYDWSFPKVENRAKTSMEMIA